MVAINFQGGTFDPWHKFTGFAADLCCSRTQNPALPVLELERVFEITGQDHTGRTGLCGGGKFRPRTEQAKQRKTEQKVFEGQTPPIGMGTGQGVHIRYLRSVPA